MSESLSEPLSESSELSPSTITKFDNGYISFAGAFFLRDGSRKASSRSLSSFSFFCVLEVMFPDDPLFLFAELLTEPKLCCDMTRLDKTCLQGLVIWGLISVRIDCFGSIGFLFSSYICSLGLANAETVWEDSKSE